jgi:hypothetical protein
LLKKLKKGGYYFVWVFFSGIALVYSIIILFSLSIVGFIMIIVLLKIEKLALITKYKFVRFLILVQISFGLCVLFAFFCVIMYLFGLKKIYFFLFFNFYFFKLKRMECLQCFNINFLFSYT